MKKTNKKKKKKNKKDDEGRDIKEFLKKQKGREKPRQEGIRRGRGKKMDDGKREMQRGDEWLSKRIGGSKGGI